MDRSLVELLVPIVGTGVVAIAAAWFGRRSGRVDWLRDRRREAYVEALTAMHSFWRAAVGAWVLAKAASVLPEGWEDAMKPSRYDLHEQVHRMGEAQSVIQLLGPARSTRPPTLYGMLHGTSLLCCSVANKCWPSWTPWRTRTWGYEGLGGTSRLRCGSQVRRGRQRHAPISSRR